MNSEKNTRVLLITPLPPPVGGIATWADLVLANSSLCSSTDIVVINSALRYRSIVNRSLIKRLYFGIIHWFLLLIKYVIFLSKNHKSVVHLCSAGGIGFIRDIVFAMVARTFFCRFILHIHRELDESTLRGVYSVAFSLFAFMGVEIVVLTKKAKSVLDSRYSGPGYIIPNMLDVERFATDLTRDKNNDGSNSGVVRILFVGHVVKEKGVEELIECVRILLQNKFEVELDLVGPCELVYKLFLEEKFSSIINRINFVGVKSQRDVYKYMAACDIFCLPSYTEGMPYVILEAMASGCCIIASNVGAIPEMLEEKEGVLIQPKNINALQEALAYLIKNSEARVNFGTNAKTKVNRIYSCQVIVPALCNLWNK